MTWARIIGFAFAALAATSANAQSPNRAGAVKVIQAKAQATAQSVDATLVAPRPASAQPTVGEEVIDQNGVVAAAYFVENRVCSRKGCRPFIYDLRSGALILNNRIWSFAYAPTGRGEQVVRVIPYTIAEDPQPAPSDAVLDAAPAIRKVTRPSPQ